PFAGNSTTRSSTRMRTSSLSRRCAVPVPAMSADRLCLQVEAGRRATGSEVDARRLLALGGAHREEAAVHVAALDALVELRGVVDAIRLRVAAAGREPATLRWPGHVGRTAGDGLEPRVARVLDARDRLEQRLGVGVPHRP